MQTSELFPNQHSFAFWYISIPFRHNLKLKGQTLISYPSEQAWHLAIKTGTQKNVHFPFSSSQSSQFPYGEVKTLCNADGAGDWAGDESAWRPWINTRRRRRTTQGHAIAASALIHGGAAMVASVSATPLRYKSAPRFRLPSQSCLHPENTATFFLS